MSKFCLYHGKAVNPLTAFPLVWEFVNTAPPKLRRDVKIRRQENAQGTWYVAKDPATEKFFRFRETERFILRQLDGETPPEVIRSRVEREYAALLDPGTLSTFIAGLDSAGLLDNDNSSRRRRSSRDREKRLRGSLLSLRYKILNPERILDFLIHRVRFVFSPTFLALSAVLILFSILVALENWSEFVEDLPRLWTLEAIPIFVVLGFIVISGHEFAHGLTCRHFGGRVREMGFLLMYFQPMLYCNVSDAWLFPEKSKRILVGFAGIFFELFVWAIAVLVWRVTDTDTFVNFLALMVMTGSGVKTLLNLNPLIKLDGYYILSDYLDIPNLRKKSFRYVGDLLKSIVGAADKPEVASQRERRIFMWYGVVATVASFSLIAFATFQVGSFLLEQGQVWALSVLLGLAGARVRMRIRRIFGKQGKDDEEFLDDADVSTTGDTRPMSGTVRSDAPSIPGREPRGQYKLRPAQPQAAEPANGQEQNVPRTLRPVTSRIEPQTLRQIEESPILSKEPERAKTQAPSREELGKKAKSSKSSQRKRRRKLNPIGLGFLGTFLGLLLFFGWRELRITGPFNILPIQYVDVRAEVDGVITEVMVKEGDRVRERQVIARISDRDYRAQVQQTRAQIVRAKAQLMTLETGPTRVEIDVAQAAVKRARERLQFEQARVDRSKLLYERDILSLMEYENALQQLNAAHNDLNEAQKQLTALVRGVRQEQLDAARAEIEELESQLRIYESNLQRVEIRSHAAGIVATPARQLRELLYQKVDRGSLIARVSNAKKLVVEIAVSEKDIGEIAIGQRVAFKARAFPDDTFYGVVTATAQTAGATAPAPAQQGTPAAAQAPSPNPTTILVTSEIDNASLKLKPGMTGQAKIFAGERRIISLIFRRLMQMVKVEFWSWW